jgi:hypothetical protein
MFMFLSVQRGQTWRWVLLVIVDCGVWTCAPVNHGSFGDCKIFGCHVIRLLLLSDVLIRPRM